jgi:hypothetical protein
MTHGGASLVGSEMDAKVRRSECGVKTVGSGWALLLRQSPVGPLHGRRQDAPPGVGGLPGPGSGAEREHWAPDQAMPVL